MNPVDNSKDSVDKSEVIHTPETTEQVITPPNPTGKGGFGDHPENRNPGGWKKEESISYQYNKLMRMTPDELTKFEPKTVAQKIAKQRIQEMMESNIDSKGSALMVTKEVTDRVEGKAPQSVRISDDRPDPIGVILAKFGISGQGIPQLKEGDKHNDGEAENAQGAPPESVS